jgi:hypothetical protein
MIADPQTGKNSGPVPADLPKLSFRYSAVLNFGPFLKIFKREENYQIIGVGTDTDTDTAE